MKIIKFIFISCLIFISGCGVSNSVKNSLVVKENINNKEEDYEQFFSDLSNIIDIENVSISMKYNETTNNDNSFYMQLDTVDNNIYFNLRLTEKLGVELYTVSNDSYIGVLLDGIITWYKGNMTIKDIIDLENNTTAIQTIFDKYVLDDIIYLDSVVIEDITFDKVKLFMHSKDNSELLSQYICYINTITKKVEQIDVICVDNFQADYSIFIKSIEEIVLPKEIFSSNREILSNVEFESVFTDILLKSLGYEMSITDISEL